MQHSVSIFMHKSLNEMWHRERGFTDHNLKSLFPSYLHMEICMSIFKPMIEAVSYKL
jgi:hypothetical protein